MRESVVFRSGTVLAAHDDGTYRVVADTGRGYGGGVAIDGVRPVLDTGVVIAAGQQVCLVWERPGERPKILNVSAQASGGCSGVLAG